MMNYQYTICCTLYLYATRYPLYAKKDVFANILFLQNKPNFPNAQMNITSVISMNYEQRTTNYFLQNKPNQTQPVVSLSNLF